MIRFYRFSVVLIFTLLLSLHLFSQENKVIDSLYKQLDETKRDTVQMKLYRSIGDFYLYKNTIRAIQYFEKANELAIQFNRTLDIASNYFSLGYCSLEKGSFDQSIEYYLKSVRLYIQMKDTRRLTNAYLSLSNVYSRVENYSKSYEYIQLAEKQIEISHDSIQECSIIQQKGNFFFQQKKYDSAQYYSLHGLKIAKDINDEYSILAALNNIAINYKNLGKNKLALIYIDSALNLFKQKEEIYDTYSSMLNNKASIYSQLRNYQQAKIYFDESIKYALLCSNRYMEMENYRNLSEMYEKMNDFQMNSIYLKKYYSLKDSMFSIESKNKINELEADYVLEKKNIELIKKDNSIRTQKSTNRIYSILIFAACSLLTMLYINFIRIDKKKKQVEEKNIVIGKQKEDLENLNHVKDRLFSIISHDLRNPLNTLRSYLMLSDNESLTADKKLIFKNQTISAVAQTGNLLDNLLTWANMQIKSTNPKMVPVSMIEIVQDVVDTVKPQSIQKKVSINLKLDDTIIITDVNILSIALRNILTNAIKFSIENSIVTISNSDNEKEVNLDIHDNGAGMTQDQINQILQKSNQSTLGTNGEQGSGLGLFLVMELLQKIETPMSIKSELGMGSTFTLKLNKM